MKSEKHKTLLNNRTNYLTSLLDNFITNTTVREKSHIGSAQKSDVQEELNPYIIY